MAARHGVRRRYNEGCRCDDCRAAITAYQRDLRQRRANGGPIAPTAVVPLSAPVTPQPSGLGPVESGVAEEISGLAAEARPGLAQVALCLARLMDNPRAVNQQPAAAKVLATLLDRLRSASAHRRRGGLALVRTMTQKGGVGAG